MKVRFTSSFLKDLRSIRNKTALARIRETIESVENASDPSELSNMKKLRGGKQFYRLRTGDYRLGSILEGKEVIFVRCLHRKDIYRYFPR